MGTPPFIIKGNFCDGLFFRTTKSTQNRVDSFIQEIAPMGNTMILYELRKEIKMKLCAYR